MRTVETVLGPVAPEALGPTDAHEHLFLRTPALPGEALTELEPMVAEASAVRAAGAHAIADLTPIGCGRDPRRLRQLAERTGLHVIAPTGFHATRTTRAVTGSMPSPRRSWSSCWSPISLWGWTSATGRGRDPAPARPGPG